MIELVVLATLGQGLLFLWRIILIVIIIAAVVKMGRD